MIYKLTSKPTVKMNNNIKKLLPHAATKSELVDMYCDQFSETKIRKQINEILGEKHIKRHQNNTSFRVYGVCRNLWIAERVLS